jgi:hypothetical protein
MNSFEEVDRDSLPSEYDILDVLSERIDEKVDPEWWNDKAIIQSLYNNEDLAELHIYTNTALWDRSGLTPAEVEFVILAVTEELDFEFGWHHHVPEALAAGIEEDEIVALYDEDAGSLDERTRALTAFARRVVTADVDDASFARVADHYPSDVIVGIVMLASYYLFIHRMAAALGVELPDEFVGWELAGHRG